MALTSEKCRSGTDRVHEVAQSVAADVYINVQGDEPLVRAEQIATLLQVMENPAAQVESGIAALAALPATTLTARSSLYRTAPVGYLDQPDFVNAVAKIDTVLSPHALLDAVLDV